MPRAEPGKKPQKAPKITKPKPGGGPAGTGSAARVTLSASGLKPPKFNPKALLGGESKVALAAAPAKPPNAEPPYARTSTPANKVESTVTRQVFGGKLVLTRATRLGGRASNTWSVGTPHPSGYGYIPPPMIYGQGQRATVQAMPLPPAQMKRRRKRRA